MMKSEMITYPYKCEICSTTLLAQKIVDGVVKCAICGASYIVIELTSEDGNKFHVYELIDLKGDDY